MKKLKSFKKIYFQKKFILYKIRLKHDDMIVCNEDGDVQYRISLFEENDKKPGFDFMTHLDNLKRKKFNKECGLPLDTIITASTRAMLISDL